MKYIALVFMDTQALVVLEAMSAGLPVVAVSPSVFDTMVFPNKNGVLVGLDDEKVMAEVIKELWKDEKLRQKLGEGGRKWVMIHDLEHVVVQLEQLYKEVLDN